MAENGNENMLQPSTLHEAINIIKFLTTTHKQEVAKLKSKHQKQVDVINKLDAIRKKELEFLSNELHNYEVNLALRTENVAKQLTEKDEIIRKQLETIEELKSKLKLQETFMVPDITVIVDSNSDSGVAMDNEDTHSKDRSNEEVKIETKTTRKCSRRFADSISFLRRVDFSPMKYKPNNRDNNKKKEEKKMNLDVPVINKRSLNRQYSNDRPTSEDERPVLDDTVFSDSSIEPIILRPKQMSESMNNHFSDDGSEDTSEEVFDRVMTRSSIRRSVKANPKYKKINRTKSKLLEHIKGNIVD